MIHSDGLVLWVLGIVGIGIIHHSHIVSHPYIYIYTYYIICIYIYGLILDSNFQ